MLGIKTISLFHNSKSIEGEIQKTLNAARANAAQENAQKQQKKSEITQQGNAEEKHEKSEEEVLIQQKLQHELSQRIQHVHHLQLQQQQQHQQLLSKKEKEQQQQLQQQDEIKRPGPTPFKQIGESQPAITQIIVTKPLLNQPIPSRLPIPASTPQLLPNQPQLLPIQPQLLPIQPPNHLPNQPQQPQQPVQQRPLSTLDPDQARPIAPQPLQPSLRDPFPFQLTTNIQPIREDE